MARQVSPPIQRIRILILLLVFTRRTEANLITAATCNLVGSLCGDFRVLTTAAAPRSNGDLDLAPLRAKWGWILALGLVYLVVGIIALGNVLTATAASVLVVGVMMVIAGAAEVINAFQIKTWGKFLIWVLLGMLYVIGGLVAVQNPLLAATMLTLMLGVALTIAGMIRILLAFSLRAGTPWLWALASGFITMLLGLMILSRWPVSSLYVLGLFLGIDLVIAGVSWIGISLSLRTVERVQE
jgi:uncharacterized membrane protein HdeD (DUF308 family)